MSAQHTPGPWVTHEEDGEIGVVEALTKDGRRVKREVCHVLDPQGDAESARNMRLIAAAPDLLKALYITSNCAPVAAELDALPDDAEITLTFTAEDLREVRAAIAKARGK